MSLSVVVGDPVATYPSGALCSSIMARAQVMPARPGAAPEHAVRGRAEG